VSVFGATPFGPTPGPFGGPGTITLIGILPAGINEVIAVFDVAPLADDPEGFDSATNPKNWTMGAVDPSIVSTADPSVLYIPTSEIVPTYTPDVGEAVQDDETPEQIHLYMEGPMEALVRYLVTAEPALSGASCETLVGTTTRGFRAPDRGPRRRSRLVQEDRYRDWAFEFFPKDPKQPEATWRHEASGDIALHDGDASLKKRILRRMMTDRGAFSHMPDYGLQVHIKRLARNGNMQAMVNDISEQVRQEPDVQMVGVTATIQNVPGRHSAEVQIFIRRRERFDSRFTFEVPLGP